MRKRRMALGCVVFFLLVGLTSFLGAQETAEEEPPQIILERVLIQRGGLLLQPGQWEIEPALEYSFYDTRRINVSGFSVLPTLIVGVLETEDVDRNVLDGVFTTRVGIIKDLQAELRIPYRYVNDDVSTETEGDTDSESGIGDIEGTLFYQPLRERGWIPDLIMSLRGKSRTGDDAYGGDVDEIPLGTGHYSLTGTVSAVKSSDPAALFASVFYTYNFDRNVELVGTDDFKTEVMPGNSIGYNVGITLAINPELAASFGYEQEFPSSTKIDPPRPGTSGRKVQGSNFNVATAFIGITWSLSRKVTADFSFGIGLTDDAADVQARLAFPIQF